MAAEPRPEAARLSLRVKLGYGGAEGAGSLLWTVYYTFFLFFLTDVVKMRAGAAGFIVLVGSLWQALFTPVVGIVSDARRWKWGRRRPFLLASAAPYAIVAWLLFTDLRLTPAWTFVYFLVVTLLYFSVFTLEDVLYTALAAEMTQDYDERTSLVTYRTGWSQLVTIIGAAVPLSLAGLLSGPLGGERAGWSAMAAVLGLLCVPPILLTWRTTRGYELYPQKSDVRWWTMVRAALGNRTFLAGSGIASGIELDWWQRHDLRPDVHITATPAQHFAARGWTDRMKTLWGGFALATPAGRIYFAGDSGYCTAFPTIGEKLGPFDLALIPIGSYEPRWFMEPVHCTPAEAIRIHRDVRARRSLAMHFGCFPLADDGFEQPLTDFLAARLAAGLGPDEFALPEVGETRTFRFA